MQFLRSTRRWQTLMAQGASINARASGRGSAAAIARSTALPQAERGHDQCMRISRGGRVLAGIVLACIAAAAIAYGFRQPLAAWAIPKIAGSAAGANVTFGGISIHGNSAEFTGVRVTSHAGQQIAYVPRAYMTYRLARSAAREQAPVWSAFDRFGPPANHNRAQSRRHV